jgi:hypothetical protein
MIAAGYRERTDGAATAIDVLKWILILISYQWLAQLTSSQQEKGETHGHSAD